MNNIDIQLAYQEGVNNNGWEIPKDNYIQSLSITQQQYNIPILIHRESLPDYVVDKDEFCESSIAGRHDCIIGYINSFDFDNMKANINIKNVIENIDEFVLGFDYGANMDKDKKVTILKIYHGVLIKRSLCVYKKGDE